MQLSRAQQPIAAAAVTLVILCACIAAFLPPLNRHIVHSPALTVLLGLTITVSLILHLVFIGIAAKRLGRSPALWVIIALCTMPIASIIGLILFEWFGEEQQQNKNLN